MDIHVVYANIIFYSLRYTWFRAPHSRHSFQNTHQANPLQTISVKYIYIDELLTPITRAKINQFYVPISMLHSINFIRTQLDSLHLIFLHLSSRKIFKVLNKALPEESAPENLKILINRIISGATRLLAQKNRASMNE